MTLDLDLAFGSFTNLFILGWLAIAAATMLGEATRARRILLLVGGRIVPIALLLAFTIGWMLTRHLPGDITSLDGVLMGFGVPEKVLNAWFETLGLALLVARWIVDDATVRRLPALIVIPTLVATFVAAAIGLLAYLALSHGSDWVRKRRKDPPGRACSNSRRDFPTNHEENASTTIV